MKLPMKIIRFVAVFFILIERTCLSKIIVQKNGTNELTELERAAIKVLTTCNTTKTKTIVIAGDFSDNFIKSLSALKRITLVVLDNRKRSENNFHELHDMDAQRRYKADVFVTTANAQRIYQLNLENLWFSLYDNPMALTLVLAWSPMKRYEGCDGKRQMGEYLHHSNENNQLRTILMCQTHTKELLMYVSNPFINKAPEPWQSVPFGDSLWGKKYYFFVRQYQEHEDMCSNLDFDRTQDMGGSAIKAVYWETSLVSGPENTGPTVNSSKTMKTEAGRAFTFLNYFMKYINATKRSVHKFRNKGQVMRHRPDDLSFTPVKVKGIQREPVLYTTYPHTAESNYLLTQFRGNKSQLQKVLSVIDGYSWIGMYLVYLITLIFFKYFLRQPLIVGTLNLMRLTANCGLVTSPTSVSSRIYMGCLLFFVLTMQGIFVGNLAALLTHDFPDRQVDSIQDLIDLNYEIIYVDPLHRELFNDPAFSGRVKKLLQNEDCIPYIVRETKSACLMWGAGPKERALGMKLHVSSGNIAIDHLCHMIPNRWTFQEKLQRFIGRLVAGDIMMTLESLVDEKVLLEMESQEIELEPEVMTLDHLGFAFAILGIGLSCATVCFIVELMIDRYRRRVTTTPVIFLR